MKFRRFSWFPGLLIKVQDVFWNLLKPPGLRKFIIKSFDDNRPIIFFSQSAKDDSLFSSINFFDIRVAGNHYFLRLIVYFNNFRMPVLAISTIVRAR